MDKDLGKLGTVLAIQNEITRDTLNMLREQQKRQVRMIWSSMGIISMAIAVVGLAIYLTFLSLDKMTTQIEMYHHGGPAYETTQKADEGLSEISNTD